MDACSRLSNAFFSHLHMHMDACSRLSILYRGCFCGASSQAYRALVRYTPASPDGYAGACIRFVLVLVYVEICGNRPLTGLIPWFQREEKRACSFRTRPCLDSASASSRTRVHTRVCACYRVCACACVWCRVCGGGAEWMCVWSYAGLEFGFHWRFQPNSTRLIFGLWSGLSAILSAGGNIKGSHFWSDFRAGFRNEMSAFGQFSIGILVPKVPKITTLRGYPMGWWF